jgi:hypothetical protein
MGNLHHVNRLFMACSQQTTWVYFSSWRIDSGLSDKYYSNYESFLEGMILVRFAIPQEITAWVHKTQPVTIGEI